MDRNSVARPDTGKLGPGKYRVGQFVITRVGSRWRIRARHSAPNENFSTLRGAATWCRQRSEIPVCTENLIRVDDVMESPKLAE
jgi:hypothetical protein